MNIFFIKSAFRNIIKDKTYSILNILGLAVGLACVMLIFMWIRDEISYDKFHKNKDDLYIVQQDFLYNGENWRYSATPLSIADAFREEVPEIIAATQFTRIGRRKMQYKENLYFEWQARAVAPDFLTMFSFRFIEGDPETALDDPYAVVITQETALKYFGEENPVGKTLKVDDKHLFTVTGLLEDIPENSSINFTMLVNIEFMKILNRWYDSWDNNTQNTYVQLRQDADADLVSKKISDMRRERLRAQYNDHDSPDDEFGKYKLELVKLMHLVRWGDNNKGFSVIHYVYIFSVIAVFILVIACINFMNLSIARSLKRAKDIGVRKTSGATRLILIRQFFGESAIYSTLAVLIAILFVALILPVFNTLTAKDFSIGNLFQPLVFLGIIALVLLTSFLSGSYPAFFLSSFNPVVVLKGSNIASHNNILFRKSLVIFQFAISIFLIICTILTNKQTQFMKNKSLGFSKENVLYVNMSGKVNRHYATLCEELRKHPDILFVSGADHLPVEIGSNTSGFWWEGKEEGYDILIHNTTVDYDYFETLNINFIEGRPYSRDFSSDSIEHYIINERARDHMGVSYALDMPVRMWGNHGKIVGVTENFHFQPVRDEIAPLVLRLRPSQSYFALIKVRDGKLKEAKEHIEKTYEEVAPGFPLWCDDFDTRMADYYTNEERTANLLSAFSYMAIFIACLGLFGLSSYVIENRNKEIGVRKVNGARLIQILGMINKDFTIWVFISNVIACPAAFMAMKSWQMNFAYRTPMSWWIFILAGSVALLIALITISWQTWRAASRNPVEALRYE